MLLPWCGTIAEEECPSHKHVEWNVDFSPLLGSNVEKLGSPVFSVGEQRYKLNLFKDPSQYFSLRLGLYRRGPSVEGPPVRWRAGLKRGDGTFCYRNKHGELNLKEAVPKWAKVKELLTMDECQLQDGYLSPSSYLTAFFQMKAGLLTTETGTCTHRTPRMLSLSSFVGNIREDECTSHKRVEWNFEMSLTRTLSPVFEIANQSYMLEFIFKDSSTNLLLYRMGPSVDGPARTVRWWVGMKRRVRMYHHRNAFGDLDLEEEFPMWTEAKELLSIQSFELMQYWYKPITVFFQMKVDQSSTRKETCTHDSARDIFPSSDGITKQGECKTVCNFHKHVRWIIKYTKREKCWTSAVFESGKQLYRLMFSGTGGGKALRLFRLGPSVDDDPGSCVRWWAGVKRADGTYHHEIESGTLHLQKECEMWSEVAQLMPEMLHEMIMHYLAPRKRLGFVFWMRVETGGETCTHGLRCVFPRGVGSIENEEWTSCKLQHWSLDVDGEKRVTSPVFSIDEQFYLLQLVYRSGWCDLHLYRMGCSVDVSVGLWVGARSRGEMTYDCGTGVGKVNLREKYDLWTSMGLLHRFLAWEEKINLLVDFLMITEQSPSVGEVCINAEGQVHDPSYLPAEHVLFRVKDKAFRMHRAIVRFGVPRMGVLHHNINSASGISEVLVTDCEPTVFQEFLNIVESGFRQVPTAENASALYAVADAYVIDELKEMCARRIVDTMSVDTFYDVVRLCLRYKDGDLLNCVTSFLSQNKDITGSDSFKNLVSENPAVAIELMAKAFPHLEE